MSDLENAAKQVVEVARTGDGFKLNEMFNAVPVKDWSQLADMARTEDARTMFNGLPHLTIDCFPDTVNTTVLEIDYSDRNHDQQVLLDRYVDTESGKDLETPVINRAS